MSKLKNIINQSNNISNLTISVGIVKPTTHTKKNKRVSTALIYRVQELGYAGNNVPARPTLIPTIKNRKFENDARQLIKSMMSNNGRNEINSIAKSISEEVKKRIEDIKKPPLKSKTIINRINKGTTNPLVDTGQLKKSIKWIVS